VLRWRVLKRLPASVRLALIALASTLVLGGDCPNSGSGGVTIPSNDGSPPTLSFGLGQQNGADVSVAAGGAPESMTLVARTGPLNLLATADDPESGVQDVQIWMTKRTSSCDADEICASQGPGSPQQPRFSNPQPPKAPGENVSAGSILGQALELSAEIPQAGPPPGGTLTVEFRFWAVAVNYLGGSSITPVISATWTEP
jgi:hypothetical protein